MKLIGLLPVRNEAWCLGLTARAALMWCDDLVIRCHNCTDRSFEIALEIEKENPGRVLVVSDLSRDWAEMQHRQHMLELARGRGATHVAIVDADEILTGNLLDSPIRYDVANTSPGWMLYLPGYNLRGSVTRYHADGIWGKRWFSTAFVDSPELSWTGEGFHHREPFGRTWGTYRPISQGQGGTMHLWGASERRLRAKSALYKVTERLRFTDKPVAEIDRMYSWAVHGQPGHPSFGTPETWKFEETPLEWWARYAHLMRYLDLGQEPWQISEIKRLITEHGADRLAGLDLFGSV